MVGQGEEAEAAFVEFHSEHWRCHDVAEPMCVHWMLTPRAALKLVAKVPCSTCLCVHNQTAWRIWYSVWLGMHTHTHTNTHETESSQNKMALHSVHNAQKHSPPENAAQSTCAGWPAVVTSQELPMLKIIYTS